MFPSKIGPAPGPLHLGTAFVNGLGAFPSINGSLIDQITPESLHFLIAIAEPPPFSSLGSLGEMQRKGPGSLSASALGARFRFMDWEIGTLAEHDMRDVENLRSILPHASASVVGLPRER